MVNFSALNNVSTLSFNLTSLNDSTTIMPNLIDNANNSTDGYLGLGILTIIFLILIYINFKQDDSIKLDFVRSVLVSSGFTSIIGIILIITQFITSFQHVVYFIIIFMISSVIVYLMKRQGG